MRMLDLFCGGWNWTKAFAARGHECVGVDIRRQDPMPNGCVGYISADVRQLRSHPGCVFIPDLWAFRPDVILASSPCEGFAVFGMPNFHPVPAYPDLAIELFEFTKRLCEGAKVPYVMENVRSAERFVGQAVNHAGSFYLWGNAVPLLIPRGLVKGFNRAGGRWQKPVGGQGNLSPARAAAIPTALANCVADYAERICVSDFKEKAVKP